MALLAHVAECHVASETVIISALNAIANAIEGIESAKIRLRLKFWPNNFESPL